MQPHYQLIIEYEIQYIAPKQINLYKINNNGLVADMPFGFGSKVEPGQMLPMLSLFCDQVTHLYLSAQNSFLVQALTWSSLISIYTQGEKRTRHDLIVSIFKL